jgi:hypothetical protein
MHVTVLWTHAAAQAHGPETTWTGIASVEERMDSLRLHKQADAPPVVVPLANVAAYNRIEPEASE